ncbi:MAG: hypothetical protein GW893_24800, partial [Armatimonadetes bacterium]|nr:hypothetical protein [Armatimonadota bacterium]
AYRYNGDCTSGLYWYQAIDPYLKNSQVQICPSARTTNPGYGFNFDYLGYSWQGCAAQLLLKSNTTLAQVADVAGTVLICDGNNPYAFYYDRSSL